MIKPPTIIQEERDKMERKFKRMMYDIIPRTMEGDRVKNYRKFRKQLLDEMYKIHL